MTNGNTDDRYGKTVMKFSLFRNHEMYENDRPIQRSKPNLSQSGLVLHAPIPAGTYKVAAWQYDDGNIGLEIQEKRLPQFDQQPNPAHEPQPQQSQPQQPQPQQPQRRGADNDDYIE